MDYSKKSRDELLALCKERGIRGVSGKRRDELIDRLSSVITHVETPVAGTATVTATSTVTNETPTLPTTGPIRFIDLFCGLGAFHTAFPTSHFKCVLACDIDEGARRIYEANYGLAPLGDIRSIVPATMPDFDLLCAGFPCQPFSIAGNGEGFKDAVKGNLFYDILKIIDAKRPPMCLLENVKNLQTHDGGKTYRTIHDELVRRGYTVVSKVLNSSDYGSPQARQRIFIVATLVAPTGPRPFTIPSPVKRTHPVSTILDPSFTGETLNRSRYDLKEKPGRTVNPAKPHILYDVFPKPKTGTATATATATVAADAKGGRQGERVYSADAVGITVCASSGGPGAKTGLYKVGDLIRRLSVKETLRMFGFPDDYKLPGVSDEQARFYLGNSIVVDVPKMFVPGILTWFGRSV
jgi:DNA (cytosine-5)-methyltransferase 1